MTTVAITSAVIPRAITTLSVSIPSALITAQTVMRIAPVVTMRAGLGSTPTRVSAQGAPR